MLHFAFAFWWLIFPIMGFVSGLFGMWTSHRRQRDTLELMKTYAQQGKDPTEIAKLLNNGAPPPQWGPYWGGGPWAGRAWRHGPYWEWRRAIVFGCLAAGFWLASEYSGIPGAVPAFHLVAIIMGVLAAGSVLFAVMITAFPPRTPPNEK